MSAEHRTRLERIYCPVCNSNSKKLVGRPKSSSRARELIGLFIKDISVVKCLQCDLYYAYPMPIWDEKEFNYLYDDKYFSEMTQWWENQRDNIIPQRRFGTIAKYLVGEKGIFLEVGCGEGIALKYAQDVGYSIYGQDVSGYFSTVVKKKTGIDIFVGSLQDAKYNENFFDVVYMDSVLEHVNSPISLLREIHKIIKPEGILYLVLPNEDSLVNDCRGILFKYFDRRNRSSRIDPLQNPYHIIGFNKSSLEYAAHLAYFEIRFIKQSLSLFEFKKYTFRNFGPFLKSSVMFPVEFLGELINKGTTLEAILIPIK